MPPGRTTIDLHTHLHPPRLFAAIRRWFADKSDWDLNGQPTEPPEVAAVLRAAGVERFVFFSYAHKPGIARELNAWLTATARALSGYGIPLGTVHLDDPDYRAIARAALDDGCAGFNVHEDVQRLLLDDPRFDPVLSEVELRRGLVIAHVGPIPWRYDAGPGAARVERVLQRHPDLNLVVAHMGVPDTRDYVRLMERYANLYLDTTMVFARGTPVEQHGVERELLRANAERIVYGTDFPNIPYAYGAERAGVESLELGPAAEQAIFYDNAARLLSAFV